MLIVYAIRCVVLQVLHAKAISQKFVGLVRRGDSLFEREPSRRCDSQRDGRRLERRERKFAH
jgi:hypothetical protein